MTGITDSNANLVVEYSYDAWGKLLSTTGSMADTVGKINPFLYRGYYYDSESGLYYLNSRYYDPQTGRFLNADGAVSTGTGILGHNMFAYCNNNPIIMIDSDGTRPLSEPGIETPQDQIIAVRHESEALKSAPISTQAPSLVAKIKDVANNVASVSSAAGTAAIVRLKEVERFKPNFRSDGSVYFNRYLKYAKTIKAIGVISDVSTVAFTGWDLYDIWTKSSLSSSQKWLGTGIVAGGVLGGAAVGYTAMAAANAWNPVGWGMIAAGAIVLAGGAAVSFAQEQAYKKVGID